MTAPFVVSSFRFILAVRKPASRLLSSSTSARSAGARWLAPRLRGAFSAAALAFLAIAPGCTARAQTARFDGSQVTIVSNYGNGGAPYGTAVDASGDLFVTDAGNGTVSEILAVNGSIPASPTIVNLGSGFSSPIGIVLDGSGDVYVADAGTGTVREMVAVNGTVPATPTILTLGGTTTFETPYGLAFDASGNLFVADAGGQVGSIYELVATAGTISPSTTPTMIATNFIFPWGIVVDSSENIYFSDYGAQVIYKIAAVKGVIPANPTAESFIDNGDSPSGLTLDASGNLYVTEMGSSGEIQEFLAVNGVLPNSPTSKTVGGGFSQPVDTAVDSAGDVFVADPGNDAVLEILMGGVKFGSSNIGASSTPISFNFTFLTGGTISAPAVLTQGASSLDYADAGTGTCTTQGTSHNYDVGETCQIQATFDPTVAGFRRGAVELQDRLGNPINTVYATGTGLGPQVGFSSLAETSIVSKLNAPSGVATDGNKNIYIADTTNNRVLKETYSGGSYTQSIIGSGLVSPSGIAVDGAGNVYIADSGNSRVVVETLAAGAYTQSVLISGLSTTPQGIAVDGRGDVYVADGSVLKFTLANGVYTQSTLTTTGLTVNWIALDGLGNILLVDASANEVMKESLSTQTTPVAVGSGFSNPSGISVDGVGNVYIADAGNNRILKETLLSGSYTQSVLTTGVLKSPTGVAVDSTGNVYVADLDNVVLKEDVADAPAITFATTTVAGTSDATDGPKAVYLLNLGNEPLTGALALSSSFSQETGSGNPADCSSTLSVFAGAACELNVEFTPGSAVPAGTVIGTATFSDNNLNANPNVQQIVTLNGTASAAPAAAATHFSVTSSTSTVTAGSTFSITITAEDASNNTVSAFSGTVALASTDTTFSGSGNVTLTSGVGTYQVSLGTTGTQTITATSGSVTGSVQVSVQAGSPAADSIVAGSGQSASINTAFATQLQVLVVDANSHPLPGINVAFAAPATLASTNFAVPAGHAYLTTAITGANGIATASIATANGFIGQYNVTATITGSAIAPLTFVLTNLSPAQYVVTLLTDDAGTAANCIDEANASGDNSKCSFRDAVAAVNAHITSTGTDISFTPGLTASGAATIALSNGPINIAKSVTVLGPGANLLTISGSGASQILTISTGVTATVSGLTFSNASAGANALGGAINNDGELILQNSAVSSNIITSNGSGAGIYNTGILGLLDSSVTGNNSPSGGAGAGVYNTGTGEVEILNSTISGNTTGGGGGSGLYNNSTGIVAIANTTISNNTETAGGQGGGIYSQSGSAFTLESSIVAGNSATGQYADLDVPGYTVNSSNVAGIDPGPTSLIAANLAPLGNYGGTLMTMIPLPGSPAICNGVVADIPSGVTTDQRGDARTTTYNSTACVDAGAVQTNYSLIFVQQPTDVSVGTDITPAPTVQLNESGVLFPGATSTIVLALSGNGTLTGGSAATTNGVATYSAAAVSAAGTGDTLTAKLTLNSANGSSVSTVSNTFNVAAGTSQLAFGTPPAAKVTNGGNAGAAVTVQEENAGDTVVTTGADTITLTVTGPNGYSQVYTETATNGVATFNLSASPLTTDGQYTYTASSGSLTNAVVTETVSAAVADTITVLTGTGQSTAIGSAFGQPLSVKVLDAGNNPVSGVTVTFAAPSTGASASLSALTAVTGSNGTASVTATANGTANTNPYTVTASVTGNSASFSLTNTPAATTLTVTPSSTGLVYGQPVTIKATIAPAAVLTAAPTGKITFYDGTTAFSPAVAVAAASASDVITVPTTGTHNYGAQYGGDTNFSATALKPAATAVVVSKASATLNGPAKQPVTFPVGTAGTTQVTLAGQYAGTGISLPGGTITYTVNGTTDTATITNGAATITLPSTWPVGSYSMLVTYAGDDNYTSAPSITVPFSITAGAAVNTTTTLKASSTTAVFGSSVSLTATVVAASGTTVPSGSITFLSGTTTIGTAALNANGVATYPATTLPVGTDSITAVYAGNTSFNASTSSAVKVIVTGVASTTTLTTSSASVPAGTAVTFTATVTPKTPMPTGTVTFDDGTKALGNGTLNASGVATYITSTLATGVHTITAVYGGNAEDATSTSSALTETITSVTAPTASFTMTAKTTSLSVAQGSSGNVELTLTALNGFAAPVTFSCSGLPVDSTCTIPSPATPTAAGTTTTVTINTDTTATAKLLHGPQSGSMTALAGAGLAGFTLLFGIPARKRLRRLGSLYTVLMAVLLGTALASMSMGCGGGSSSNTPTTPTGTSTVTVTATGGTGTSAITKTVSVQLTVTN